jgi:hypothetical protein
MHSLHCLRFIGIHTCKRRNVLDTMYYARVFHLDKTVFLSHVNSCDITKKHDMHIYHSV